jgi:uncharacterized protein YdhG (YjbR/CyaY superfamily)
MANVPTTIDEYISAFPPKVRAILGKIRATISEAAPDAQEVISYRMPAFKQQGVLLYFAAFKAHIGLFPPVSGEPSLEKALAPYRGPKRNLRFPLDRPIPYGLIRRIARLRVKQNAAKTIATARASKRMTKTLKRTPRTATAVPKAGFA